MLKLYSFTFNPFQENTYILASEGNEAIIIDPGMYFEEERKQLQSFIEKENLKPVQVILTHAHLDHVFGLQWVNERYNLEPYLHANEQIILKNAEIAGVQYGLKFKNYVGPLHFIADNDTIQLGTDELRIFFVPGHSPGSLVFYIEAQDLLIAGDTLFKESIGRTDLPFSNHDDLVTHIKNKLFLLPDSTKVFPGHGEHTTIGHEKHFNSFLG